MTWPKPRRWWLAALLGVFMVDSRSTSGQQRSVPYVPPNSLDDPRVEVIRRSARIWDARSGPRREVVDQVCLVPDLPTFLQAIASWDEGHFFPILFDDVETSFRFIRAFQPARIFRMPKSASPISDGKTWEKSVEAVGASWVDETDSRADRLPGDIVPKRFGPTQPGMVFSSADASMLAGAVALAAGRFQPLIPVDFPRKFPETLTIAEADAFSALLTSKVKERSIIYERMGDDCDFLTIAGDWPYAWRDADGHRNALDDRIGRMANPPHRWAYTGRLLGNPAESAYRAMCSLFLQPDSSLMFNGYDEGSAPWSFYSMKVASARLSRSVKTSQVSGPASATVEGWHEAFDPLNKSGLVLVNSSGSPTDFNLPGGAAATSDIPFTVPTAVLMIHSFSAENPTDPETIAGRWLANGAFVYFGSMNEPFVQAFRTPSLVADMISEHLPLAVAIRATLTEPYGTPWRLVFLGDPLYRIKPVAESRTPRTPTWVVTNSWLVEAEPPRPSAGTDLQLFHWAYQASLARLSKTGAKGPNEEDLVETLLGIDRTKLPEELQQIDDALLIDCLLYARKRSALKSKLLEIPDRQRSPLVKRVLGTLVAMDLNLAISRKDFASSRNVWQELMRSDLAGDLKSQASSRVGKLADTPDRRRDWIDLLRTTLVEHSRSPESKSIADELKRVESEATADRNPK